ncbi:MAG: transposase family protein [Methanocorpusculum parvum]|nr:transposase family protein [Methanocorpusculum parvum]
MVGISSLEGTLFATAKPCPLCGGKPQPYDTKKKLYVILKTPTGRKKIMVNIRRFKCKKCGNLIYAEEPFYPDTRLGSAIVDMAISLARLHSYSHTAEIMKALGIEIDRGSVRNYALSNLPIPPANFLYGMQLPNSFISLMTKEISGSKGSVSSGEILASSGYPSAYKPPLDGKNTSAEFQKQKKRKNKQ